MGGNANNSIADGGILASRGDMVVIGINYRVNTLGFWALKYNRTRGNDGLVDQINALDWVHKETRDFGKGGGPDRITIFGQSAGAARV